jgi:beta-lactamase class A
MREVPSASWRVELDGDVLTEHEPERPFSGASMIKTPLAALLVADLAAGRRAWTDQVPVSEVMRAPGDGLLCGLALPRTVALDELLTLMIAVSDNTATNAVIECLGGLEAANARMREAGWSARVNRWIGAVSDEPLSRLSLADHQAALASVLAAGTGFERAFLVQQDRRALARPLRLEMPFAHKTGTIDRVRHDAGALLLDSGTLWIGCFTDGGPVEEHVDHPSCLAMAAAARDTLAALGLERCLV